MNALSSTASLAAALAKVQARLPKLERDRTVEVEKKSGGTYTYSYVTLATLSEAVLPLLAEHGLAFTAFPGTGSDGKLRLCYSLLHESGEVLSGEFPIAAEGGIQMIGGRITYARRYCLAAVVGVAAEEDDESQLSNQAAPRTAQRAARQPRERGATAQRSTPPPPLPGEGADPDPVTKPQLTKIHTVFSAIGWEDREDRLRASSTIVGRQLSSSTQLTKAEAHTLIETLEMVAGQDDPSDRLTELLASVRQAEADGGES